jgi:hypothetical protein
MFRRSRSLLLAVGLALGATVGVAVTTAAPAWAWYGSLDVHKIVVVEPGASVPSGTTFTVQVSCTLDSEDTGHWTLVFDATGALVPARSDTALPIGSIPKGSTCSANETVTGGANKVAVSDPVVIIEDETDVITVTNTFTAPVTPVTPVTPVAPVEVSPEVVTVAPAAVPAPVLVSPTFTG